MAVGYWGSVVGYRRVLYGTDFRDAVETPDVGDPLVLYTAVFLA